MMNENNEYTRASEKTLAAVCGLFCPSCTLYIGTHEDPARLQLMAERFGLPVEALACHGCRSDKRAYYCEEHCTFTSCAVEKGIDFCGECADYPCELLKTFQAEMPHRIELWDDQQRIRDVGVNQWFMEKRDYYACPDCQTINSAYDIACRSCGVTPGCAYISAHQEAILDFMQRNMQE
jgi:hypothetical protein